MYVANLNFDCNPALVCQQQGLIPEQEVISEELC